MKTTHLGLKGRLFYLVAWELLHYVLLRISERND